MLQCGGESGGEQDGAKMPSRLLGWDEQERMSAQRMATMGKSKADRLTDWRAVEVE